MFLIAYFFCSLFAKLLALWSELWIFENITWDILYQRTTFDIFFCYELRFLNHHRDFLVLHFKFMLYSIDFGKFNASSWIQRKTREHGQCGTKSEENSTENYSLHLITSSDLVPSMRFVFLFYFFHICWFFFVVVKWLN